MTAFLFDEDHADMKLLFGPECASFVIREIEGVHGAPPVRLLRGSLLHHRYCYELSEVMLRTPETNSSGIVSSVSGQKLKPNMARFVTIICDLAETMKQSGSSLPEAELQSLLSSKNIWVVVAQGLRDLDRPKIEESLKTFGPYVGWVKVDWNNPVHMDLFGRSLFHDMFVDEKGLFKLSEWPEGTSERDEEVALLEEYGSRFPPKLLNKEEFEALAPVLISASDPGDRALLSTQRVSGNSPSHRITVGKALIQQNMSAASSVQTFSTEARSDGIEFVVPEEKLTKYLLNLGHQHGGPKAKFFRDTLGIEADDWRYLADQFCQAAGRSELYRLDVSQYGVIHGALALVLGRNGRQAVVETGWKLEKSGPASFVTAYPGDQNKAETLELVVGRVPELNLPESERWEKIHSLAHSCGMSRAEAVVPTPMVLEDWGTIWEGACGFGWVFIPDARKSFPKWALGAGVGYQSRPGLRINSPLLTQSIDKNFAYAQGYAEVLRANGIACKAERRLD